MFAKVLLVCLVVYLFSAKGYLEVSDTFSSLRTAQSIVDRHRLDIPRVDGFTVIGREGKSYSKYGIGLALYFVPFVAVSDVLSHLAHLPASDLAGFLISFANIPFALLTIIFFYKLVRMYGVTGGSAWLLPLALGLGTLAWKYAGYDFSEEMQMGLLLLAFYGVLRGAPRSILLGGIGFSLLFLVKIVYAAYFPLFLLYLFTRPGTTRERVRQCVLFTAPLIVIGCVIAWFNWVRFGNPLESGYGAESHGFIPAQLWYTVPRLLGSLDKGLFVFSPVLLLGLLGWREFAKRDQAGALLCAALVLVNLLLSGAWYGWGGGWAWGPRLLVPTIPLWFLPVAFFFRQRQSRAAVLALAGFTVLFSLLQIPGILVKDQEIHTIKMDSMTTQEQQSAPSDYVAAWILLRHKLSGQPEIYRASDFHAASDRTIDLEQARTFRGVNVWTEEVARQFHKPAIRYLPLTGLLAILLLAYPWKLPRKTAMAADTSLA